MASLNREIRILLVEDNEEACEIVALCLTEYRLTTAHTFAEGVRQARQRYFDLYILDKRRVNELISGALAAAFEVKREELAATGSRVK